jgi:hypothetical protein
MSAWVEIVRPEGRRSYVKASTIERIDLPSGLAPTDIARPDHPIRIAIRDGVVLDCINQTAMHILHGILVEAAQVCPADDGQETA